MSLFEIVEVDPAEVPDCPRCGRLMAAQGADETWRCGQCDRDELRKRWRIGLRLLELKSKYRGKEQ